MMVIGVKYCGGCNPRYNRRSTVDRISREYSNVKVEPIQEGIKYDLVIVICGCHADCFDYSSLFGRYGRIEIFEEKDFEKIQDLFKRLEVDNEL